MQLNRLIFAFFCLLDVPMLIMNLIRYRAFAPRLSALMLVSAALATNSYAGLITNGSFESFGAGADGGAGRSVYVAGIHTNEITGWTLSGDGDVYLHHTPAIGNAIGENFNFAQDGETYLDLSGGIGGGVAGRHATIFQDFATTTAQSYVLTFYSGAALTSVAPTINVQVIGANPIFNQTITALTPSTNINWIRHEFTFVADSSTTRLSFRDLSSSDDNVSFVDNVSVNPSVNSVPEPSSWVGLLSMSTALVFYRARKKSKTKS